MNGKQILAIAIVTVGEISNRGYVVPREKLAGIWLQGQEKRFAWLVLELRLGLKFGQGCCMLSFPRASVLHAYIS